MEVVVVGGGVGGLYAAVTLSRLEGVGSVQVLEAQESVGGRMRTRYGSDGSPLYEEGAWRISSDHILMMRLCTELNLNLLEVASEGIDAFRTWLDPGACDGRDSSPPPDPSVRSPTCPLGTLSSWDLAAERLGVRGADLEGARSGYAGIDAMMAAGSDAYGVETAEKATRTSARYYVPVRGMSSICARLREELERRPRCHVRLKTRVVDVRPAGSGYMVVCEERVGGNAFLGRSLRADVVVVAAPPSHVAKWEGVARQLKPILASLSAVPLLKIFSEAGPAFADATGLRGRAFHVKANTLGQQIISNTYPGTRFVQLAYCAGQRAEALERLRLCGDVMGALTREIAGLVSVPERAELSKALLSEKHEVHFWSEAVHVWNPSYDLDVALKSAQACLVPHATLPRLFLCGEAFSTVQGWGEGALQTAELVVAQVARAAEFLTREGALPVPRIPRGLFPGPGNSRYTMVYDGRILEVGSWAKAHPGGEGAIKAHLGEDVTQLWNALMHPRYALGIVFALQVGWVDFKPRSY
jgi:Flavin containing amine oxidoreductase/Cytochrome b5-like Heme/Steroid binding domain